MKDRFKRYTAAILSISLVFASFNLVYANNGEQIIIYHTNDSHGYVQGDGEKITGIDMAAALKKNTPDSLLVDAGDATQGLPIASINKGAGVIELMNIAGYDLMTPGNHEFDFGEEQFLSNVKRAEFPVVSANVYKNDALLLEGVQEGNKGCHTIIEKNGVKIGFFGLTTTQTATATNPFGIKNIEFRNETECAKREIDELEAEDADVIIAVCHIGNGDAPCTSTELANSMTGEYQGKIDVIIDGHSHSVENIVQNDTLIVQTGCNMSSVGQLTLNVSGDDVTASDKLLTPKDLTDIASDADVSEKIEQIKEEQKNMLSQKLGTAVVTFWAGWIGNIAPGRFVETNYGDFTADAFQNAGKEFLKAENNNTPVIAVENGGGIRESLPNGEITKESLISAFPFSNTLYLKEITPKILYDVMEVSGSMLDGQDTETGMLLQTNIFGGFLQISGFTVEFNPNGTNEKVTSITLDGDNKPLDRNDSSNKIMLVSNNYIMNGGNDYTMLGSLPKYGEIGGEVETIQLYLEKCLESGVLNDYTGNKKRIVMNGGYTPQDYKAFIKITDESGNSVENKKLSYRVDGGNRQNAVTDSNGLLTIVLSDGAHGIRLGDNQQEVYVNNYTGLGITEDSIRSFPSIVYLVDGSCDTVEETTETTTLDTFVNTVKVSVNDSTIEINNNVFDIDTKPYISDGSVMVPLRVVALAVLGGDLENPDNSNKVNWDNISKTASINFNGETVEFKAGNEYMYIDGKANKMDNNVGAEIKEGRMYIPFRALGDALGASVNWIENTKTVVFQVK